MAEDQIAFARLRDAGDGVRSWIHLVEPTSAAVRPLTPAELSLYDPYWSPDGSRLVALGGDQLDPWPQVYVIDAASGESDRISNDGALKLHPVWSPDASEILLDLSVCASGYHLFAIGLGSG